jgi:CRP/FNR family cyclic AMP-dependent transcriptional regulator
MAPTTGHEVTVSVACRYVVVAAMAASALVRNNVTRCIDVGRHWDRLVVRHQSEEARGVNVDVLKQAPLFRGLDDEAADALSSTMIEVPLRRGEVLFHEGDSGDRLYVVTDGKVKLGRRSADGRENLIAVLGPGQMLGELSLFDPGPRSATVTAVTDSVLASLSHEELGPWLEGRTEVARALLGQLAGRLRRTNDVVADLVFSDVPGRVAKALLELASRFGRAADDGVHVHHDLTQEELAQLVGASRETVNKALADFASRGWLRLEARSVVLLDADRLKHRAR